MPSAKSTWAEEQEQQQRHKETELESGREISQEKEGDEKAVSTREGHDAPIVNVTEVVIGMPAAGSATERSRELFPADRAAPSAGSLPLQQAAENFSHGPVASKGQPVGEAVEGSAVGPPSQTDCSRVGGGEAAPAAPLGIKHPLEAGAAATAATSITRVASSLVGSEASDAAKREVVKRTADGRRILRPGSLWATVQAAVRDGRVGELPRSKEYSVVRGRAFGFILLVFTNE